jgi:enoyl-CoA hydratase/carnithine racemase
VLGPARLGHARAFELLVLGETWSAERGLMAGLINAIVAPGELAGTALAAARRLAAKPRAAMFAARRMLKVDPALVTATIAKELAEYRTLMRSPEAREAFAAFLEKRKPDFAKARRG